MIRNIAIFLSIFFALNCNAQVPEPTILSIESFNGDTTDNIDSKIVVTNDSGFIISLSSNSSNGNIMNICSNHNDRRIFIKYNKHGTNIEWTKCIEQPRDSAFSMMLPQANGDYLFGGIVNTPSPTSRDIILYREDQFGNPIWGPKRFGGTAGERIVDMINTDDGGVIILARSNSDDGDVAFHYGGVLNLDIWIFKIDTFGDIEWSNVIGGSSDEEPHRIIPLKNKQGYYIIGNTRSNDYDAIDNHGEYDFFVVKIDIYGNKTWSKCYGGSKTEGFYGRAATIVNDHDLLVTTSTNSDNGDISNKLGQSDIWLFYLDSSGKVVWNNCYGTSNGYEYASDVCIASNGKIWIGGESYQKGEQVNANYGNEDVLILQIDSNGNFISSKVLGSSKKDLLSFLHPLPNHTILAGGTYEAPSVNGLPKGWISSSDIFLANVAPWPLNILVEDKDNVEIKIYPNPTKDNLNIDLIGNSKRANILISDFSGKIIHRDLIKKKASINVSNWSRGLYMIEVEIDKKIYNLKISLL